MNASRAEVVPGTMGGLPIMGRLVAIGRSTVHLQSSRVVLTKMCRSRSARGEEREQAKGKREIRTIPFPWFFQEFFHSFNEAFLA